MCKKSCRNITKNLNIAKNFFIMLNNLQQMNFKTASKRAIQNISETTGGFIGNKIAGRTTKVSKSL